MELKKKSNGCLIKISIQKEGAHTVVYVEDNGQGMSAERIMQIESYGTTSEHGTGIGLYNVNRRLTIMFGPSGSLHIDSKLDAGTKVSFTMG